MFCQADSLAVRISCNFLYAASRLARIALSCSSALTRASALIWALLVLSLSTSASHFLICDSIIVKYSSFLLMVTLLCQVAGNAAARDRDGGRIVQRPIAPVETCRTCGVGRYARSRKSSTDMPRFKADSRTVLCLY